MPKSVSHILCSHKGSAMRDLHHAHSKHVERLQNMKPVIDMSVNNRFKMNNAKKDQDAAERNATIERENKLLLGKMYTIMNSENTYLSMTVPYNQRSLNIERRRQEYDRIARENQASMQRILQRGSNFDARKLDQEWKRTQKTLRAIAQEPWVLDAPTPPRRKLDPLEPAFAVSPRADRAAVSELLPASRSEPVASPSSEPDAAELTPMPAAQPEPAADAEPEPSPAPAEPEPEAAEPESAPEPEAAEEPEPAGAVEPADEPEAAAEPDVESEELDEPPAASEPDAETEPAAQAETEAALDAEEEPEVTPSESDE
jgi:hypothetical protein